MPWPGLSQPCLSIGFQSGFIRRCGAPSEPLEKEGFHILPKNLKDLKVPKVLRVLTVFKVFKFPGEEE